ncbi:MAG: SDR family oxidoreductase [Anaerolineae bacterium]|nr:SDR family oxidoreductase [Anaerolineae bacterium]
MTETKPVAIVGVGAILPDAPDVQTFWTNIQRARYSITDVPPERWDADLYWDPDPSVPDKTYTKIGGWVRGFHFEPFKWGIAIPPRVLAVMDDAQKFAIAASYQALADYGYPQRQLDPVRVAVILGNALGGELHYRTTMRILMPEYAQALSQTEAFKNLPAEVQRALLEGMRDGIRSKIPDITEDTMPGELGNIIAGRVANVFNFAGPNYVTDAACASSLAAIQGAIEGLNSYHFDAVLTGGVDRHMGVESFVKFCKIGALSPDGSRPYADGANGFVMGEGTAIFLLKRLADAERDGDKIYAVIRSVAGSSDGKGKGITAPNPLGQQRAIERAWQAAGVSPASAGLIEGHGTSTRVGDVTEVNSLNAVFGQFGLPVGSVAIGSVKSNIGHLKSAAGAAGVLKVALALHDKVLPPSANFTRPNPNIDFPHLPFYVNTALKPWERPPAEIRRAGVSSFGFGGTNFHMVMEEWVPGLLTGEKKVFAVAQAGAAAQPPSQPATPAPLAAAPAVAPYRGLLFLSGSNVEELKQRLSETLDAAQKGVLPPNSVPSPSQLAQPERLTIDYTDAEELAKRAEKALKGFETNTPAGWQALTGHAIYRGSGQPGKLAFLFPGQGSQYVNMLRDLREVEPAVAETFREADEVMTPILGRPLTSYIYDEGDEESQKKAEAELRNTTITQPAVLTTNVALLRVMEKFGFKPDLVIGHSLGEYAALVAAGVLTFPEALQVVSARGREMAKVSVADNGCMAAVSAPLEQVEEIIRQVNGYVVIANINSPLQCVIGGETPAVDAAIVAFQAAGLQATKIPVSHAFHTRIVAPASEPLRQVIAKMDVRPPRLPVVANVTGKIYPNTKEEILDILAQQVASPVQFIKGVRTLYEQGARVFVEVGPKRVLNAIVTDILKDQPDTSIFATNHPRKGGIPSFNEALCGLYAAGVGGDASPQTQPAITLTSAKTEPIEPAAPSAQPATPVDGKLPLTGSVVISGAGLGLPGSRKAVFAEDNIQRILKGEIFIESLPVSARQSMAEKRPVRLVKSEAGAIMQTIDDPDQAVKLGGQAGSFDVVQEFGVSEERAEATDISTQLAIAAGIDALRDAGIPLVMNYRRTSKGTYLPNRWMLPEALADETGVIFASAFPGLDRMAEEAARYYEHQHNLRQLEEYEALLATFPPDQKKARAALEARISALKEKINQAPYSFDRKFVFRVLAMGHSQFAEHIGARGPNTHVNAACASTTHAVAVAEDWIRAGRCRRVIIVAGDDVTRENMVSWIGTGLFASGAATTEGDVRQAVLPFDRRRNGMIMGMGAAALVVESEDAVRERGMRGICEVLASQIANSAFHGTRLDVDHVCQVMDRVLRQAEDRFGVRRQEIASRTVFVSHETYTPARGGSASAEVRALRYTFGDQANRVIIANTKGFTGHSMGVGVEDVVAVKALETAMVPPIANLDDQFEPDPELGDLNLSRGGQYPVQYALRLGAGFGSQIAMTLLRKIPSPAGGRIHRPDYDRWLAAVAGYEKAELEVVQHTLRIRDAGQPVKAPARSTWQFGQGPTAWADFEKEAPVVQPARSEVTVQATAPVSGNGHAPQPASIPAPQIVSPTPQAAPAVGVDDEAIKAHILSVVSEKTGYPAEMLDLDLDLEADLGIDTVKQAELFAAVRTHYGIPRREDLRLADYNTLAKVMGFIKENLGAAQPAAAVVSAPPAPAAQSVSPTPQAAPAVGVDDEAIKAHILSVVSEKTGYPAEMLDLDLDLEADLGIDTVKQAELFAAVRTHYGIPRREDLRLADYNTLAKVMGFIKENLGAAQPAAAVVSMPPAPAAQSVSPAPQAAPAADGDDEAIKSYVLSVVSEKTGYPAEMLDLDLDLEADLGIDTVKQAELFATIRTHYDIPRREDLRLADYNTLAKVIQFMREALQARLAPQASAQEAAPAAESAPQPEEEFQSQPIEEQPAAVIQRRVPIPVLRPRIDLCMPTSAALEQGWRVLIVGGGKTADLLARRLRTRQVSALLLKPAGPEAMAKTVAEQLAKGPIHGVYFLPALEAEPPLADLTPKTWQAATRERLFSLYALMRALPEDVFLVCATRFGGLHGYTPKGTSAPLGGAVSGFAKALARERPNTLIKVVDFEEDAPESLVASRLIEETLRDPAVVEVGWENEQRFTVVLSEQPAPLGQPGLQLDQGAVFLVSGGTGGITAPIVTDLAQNTGGHFYLLGRSPLPAADDPDLQRLKSDRDGLKKDLMARLAQQGGKATPVEVEQKISILERAAATLEAIAKVEGAGGKAVYLPCDVSNPAAVSGVVKEIKKKEGRVDVLIHAAGVERSRKLENKPLEEFENTFAVKADGFFNLYYALQQNKCLPRAVVAFSSVAGRLGNSGQTDYAAANDLLARLALAMRRQRPEMQTLVIDWGAWAEVGMASRGNIPRLMEMAGIAMMKPAEAAPLVFRELTSGASGEVVLSGSIGVLLQQARPDGGLDVEQANKALTEGKPIHTMFSRITGLDLLKGVILEADLDPQTEQYLKDHALNGIPVLPGVMGIEGFSVAARHISSVLGSTRGSFQVAGLEDIQFLAPFKFYRNEKRRIAWNAQAIHTGNGLVVHVSLESNSVSKIQPAERLLHFTGKVKLLPSNEALEKAAVKPPHWNGAYKVEAEQIYRLYFHGPTFQVLEGVQRSEEGVTGKLRADLPPIIGDRQTSLTRPALVELCLQTAGIWEIGKTGVLGLPGSIGSLKLYEVRASDAAIFAQVQPRQENGHLSFDAQVVDARGRLYLELKDYRTSPLPYAVESGLIEPLKKLVE